MTTDTTSRGHRRLLPLLLLLALVAATVLAAAVGARPATGIRAGASAADPARTSLWQRLLSSSRDLGPSRAPAEVSVQLTSADRPTAVQRWASAHGLRLQWRSGQRWAVLSGPADRLGPAFGVDVHDYRSQTGRRYYGARSQPAVPVSLSRKVAALGRIGSLPLDIKPMVTPRLVPPGGLTPEGGLRAYDALSLAKAGYTGKGQTIVFPEVTSFDQADMDAYTQATGLSPISVQRVGAFAGDNSDAGETTMDIQVAHALAPDAKLVIADLTVVDVSPSSIAQFFSSLDQQFPGALWSISFNMGCDKMYSATDLQVIDQAVATAVSHGTTGFMSSGDTDGLECKEFLDQNFNSPPSVDDVGINAVASLPSMTSAGGTALSVTTAGEWLSEAVWVDPTLTLGTGGGVSTVIPRPDFQQGVGQSLPSANAPYRIVPDLSAVADSRTGFLIVVGGEKSQGGGTSQSAPILAGLTAVMNDYLDDNGGHAIGALNPLLYEIGKGHAQYPAFHDVTLGGNALWYATPGFDPASGWGTPDTWNLVRDILAIQKEGGR